MPVSCPSIMSQQDPKEVTSLTRVTWSYHVTLIPDSRLSPWLLRPSTRRHGLHEVAGRIPYLYDGSSEVKGKTRQLQP